FDDFHRNGIIHQRVITNKERQADQRKRNDDRVENNGKRHRPVHIRAAVNLRPSFRGSSVHGLLLPCFYGFFAPEESDIKATLRNPALFRVPSTLMTSP